MLQKIMSHITAVKKDMIILEKSEFSALLADNEVRPLIICAVLSIIIITHWICILKLFVRLGSERFFLNVFFFQHHYSSLQCPMILQKSF